MKIGSWEIKPRDRVTIVDSRGVKRTGRANPLLFFPEHVVLNIGNNGMTANASNIVAVNGAEAPL